MSYSKGRGREGWVRKSKVSFRFLELLKHVLECEFNRCVMSLAAQSLRWSGRGQDRQFQSSGGSEQRQGKAWFGTWGRLVVWMPQLGAERADFPACLREVGEVCIPLLDPECFCLSFGGGTPTNWSNVTLLGKDSEEKFVSFFLSFFNICWWCWLTRCGFFLCVFSLLGGSIVSGDKMSYT